MLATDVDLVILATPPVFRPAHLKAAIEAGKHVFTEKPVAVDPAGVRSVIATSELAAARGSRSSPARSAATRPTTSRS